MEKSAFEVQGEARVLRESNGTLVEEKSSPWIKLSTTFRERLLRELKGSQLSVFLCLALHIDNINRSFPSIETIANETGFSDRQVMRAIKKLEERNWITVERDEGQVNVYKLCAVVAYGREQPLDVTPDKMSPPIYRATPDSHVTPTSDINDDQPLTMSPLTMSHEEEPKEETNKKEPVKKNKDEPISKNQSNWIKALTYIGNHEYKNHPLNISHPFQKYWQSTEVHSEGNGKIEILCVGEDPEYQKAWLEDRGEGVAEKALTAVTGNRIEVEYVLKGE